MNRRTAHFLFRPRWNIVDQIAVVILFSAMSLWGWWGLLAVPVYGSIILVSTRAQRYLFTVYPSKD
jgi:hypothetical protein